MTPLVVIETKRGLAALERLIRTKSDTLVISSQEQIVMALRRRGIKAEWLGDYSSLEDLNFADEQAFWCARNWYKEAAVASRLTYRGILLGSLVELSFGSYLAKLFHDTVRVKNYLSKNSVQEVLLICDDFHCVIESFYLSADETLLKQIFEGAGCQVKQQLIKKKFSPSQFYSGFFQIIKHFAKEALRWGYRFYERVLPRKKISDEKRGVLFCSAEHHVQDVLNKMGMDYSLYYLDETFQAAKLNWIKDYGLKYFTFKELAKRQKLSSESQYFLRTFQDHWPGLFEDLASSEKHHFLGANIFGLAHQRMACFASRKVSELVYIVDVIYDFLKKEQIDVIVLDEDVIEFRRTLVSVAKKMGVRSLVILHATTPSFCSGKDLVPLTASLLAVGGEAIKKDAERWGIGSEQIVVTGVPRYDSLRQLQKAKCLSEIQQEVGAILKNDLVVFASTYITDRLDPRGDWWDIERAYRDFFYAMADYPEKTALLKLHRTDMCEDWVRAIAEECGTKNAIFLKIFDLTHAMAAADAVVSFQSSAVTEALLLQKPVVIMDYLKRIPPLYPLSDGAECPFVVKDRETLKGVLGRMFSKDQDFLAQARLVSERVVQSWAGKCDGHSSERVVQIIRRLANPKL